MLRRRSPCDEQLDLRVADQDVADATARTAHEIEVGSRHGAVARSVRRFQPLDEPGRRQHGQVVIDRGPTERGELFADTAVKVFGRDVVVRACEDCSKQRQPLRRRREATLRQP